MSDNRLTEADERLVERAEADLHRLLSIEPSPELAAKVRTRVGAGQRRGRRWMAGWRLASAASSIVIVAVIVSLVVGRSAERMSQPALVVPNAEPARVLQPPSTFARVDPPARTPAMHRIARIRAGAPRSYERNEPEVLVPPDQRRAIQRALSRNNGALDARMFAAPVLIAGDRNGVPPVAPIVIDPVAVPAIDLGGDGVERKFP